MDSRAGCLVPHLFQARFKLFQRQSNDTRVKVLVETCGRQLFDSITFLAITIYRPSTRRMWNIIFWNQVLKRIWQTPFRLVYIIVVSGLSCSMQGRRYVSKEMENDGQAFALVARFCRATYETMWTLCTGPHGRGSDELIVLVVNSSQMARRSSNSWIFVGY